ncbi:hypothetical protein C9374_000251 [Naegleria lovaniensis]|uniref:RNA ligase (ATP) n=1 Tax=Naegleria lovaniensis TaxID=51637 RepID=A0AA88KTS6_NAELO|nr:uncharacterized protein C9374_000251 [Naegleria lovaniensis]KAG2388812.1 hypothetical protein C9374_000251 [Naegleria lovaniensis]
MFKSYSSIQNHYMKGVLDFQFEPNFSRNVEWVVTEKVHGSNFSYVVSMSDNAELDIQVAKRTEILVTNDPSYYPIAVQKVREIYDKKIPILFKRVVEIVDENFNINVNRMHAFGELFGGHYPHKDVKNVSGRVPIQRHVYYHTEFDFYIFDIYFSGVEKETMKEKQFFLPFDLFVKALSECEFNCYAKELFRGKFEDCLNFDSVFDSVIPSYYELPTMPHHTNICEGIIIKPVKDMYTQKRERMIIKKKNEAFNEKIGQAKKPKQKTTTITEVSRFTHEKGEQVMEDVNNYINENRLEATISKLGDIFKFNKLREQAIYLLAQDALKDYKEENSELWNELPKEDQKTISRALPKISQKFVETYVKERIEDNQ